MRPNFIVFEGIDGCGKTTQAQMLTDHLASKKVGHVIVEDPGTTTVGVVVRDIVEQTTNGDPVPYAELFLFAAARTQMVEKIIKPALKSGKTVIGDRFSPSTIAYQGHARGLDMRVVSQIVKFAEQGCNPDLYILLDTTVEQASHRRTQHSRIERMGNSFQAQVRESYLKQAAAEPERWLVLDASKPPSELQSAVRKRLENLSAQ